MNMYFKRNEVLFLKELKLQHSNASSVNLQLNRNSFLFTNVKYTHLKPIGIFNSNKRWKSEHCHHNNSIEHENNYVLSEKINNWNSNTINNDINKSNDNNNELIENNLLKVNKSDPLLNCNEILLPDYSDHVIQQWIDQMRRLPNNRDEWMMLINKTKLSRFLLYRKLWYRLQKQQPIKKSQKETVFNVLRNISDGNLSKDAKEQLLIDTNLSRTQLNYLIYLWKNPRIMNSNGNDYLKSWVKEKIIFLSPQLNSQLLLNGKITRNLNRSMEIVMNFVSSEMPSLKEQTKMRASDINHYVRSILLKYYFVPTEEEIENLKKYIYSLNIQLETLTLSQKRSISEATGLPIWYITQLTSEKAKPINNKEKLLFKQILFQYNHNDLLNNKKLENELIIKTGWTRKQIKRQIQNIYIKKGFLSIKNKQIIENEYKKNNSSIEIIKKLSKTTELSERQIRNYIQKLRKSQINKESSNTSIGLTPKQNISQEINSNSLDLKNNKLIPDIIKQLGLKRIKPESYKPTKLLELWLIRNSFKTPTEKEIELLQMIVPLNKDRILSRIQRIIQKKNSVIISEEGQSDLKRIVSKYFPDKIPLEEKNRLKKSHNFNDNQIYQLSYKFRKQLKNVVDNSNSIK